MTEGTKVGSIYAELSIDDQRFQRTLTGAKTGFTTLRQAADRAAAQVDASFRQSGQHVGRTGDAARDASRDMGRVGDAARDAAGDIERVGDAARDAASDVGRMGDAGSAAGGSFVGEFGSKLQGLAGKGGPIAAALVGVAGLGLAAGALMADAISDGMDRERSIDLTQARLGVDEETAHMIGTAAGDAYAAGWGESIDANMDTIRQAIHGGILNGEETAGEMQPVVSQLTAVTELLGTDMPRTIGAVRMLMLNGLAPDATAAMDLVVRAYQRGADVGDDLLDVIREYSNGWENAGFSAEFAMGLIGQALENGVDWADRPADALREFGRRMTEEGDTIKTSIGAINDEVEGLALPVEELFDRLKAGGPDAEKAFDEVFDAIRQIEDPLARNEIVMGLLGDTAGDFINAFGKWDPSAAVEGLGEVSGAAENAMRTMGDNAATDLATAKNSITASADEIKLALAGAFGPHLQDAANWVSTHKPEVIGFFTDLADAGFATLDALAAFASGSLRAFASLQEGIGDVLGKILPAMGGMAQAIGGILERIPGMEDTGKALQDIGESVSKYGEIADGAADKAREFADVIDAGRPKLDEMRESVRTAGQEAQNAAEMTRLFGGEVQAVPDGKSVIVKALTDEARQRLTDFGFQVENLKDGESRITANTAEGQQIIDDFVSRNDGRRIPMQVDVDLSQLQWTGEWSKPARQPLTNADGAIYAARFGQGSEDHRAQIAPAGAWRVWAEEETGGEAYIPLAPAKRPRSTAILADVAARFGYDLLQRGADGGVTAFALGGFGGAGQNGGDGEHIGSWEVAKLADPGGIPLSTASRDVPLAVWGQAGYRAAALGVGSALALASGWDDSGQFQGFDTGGTSIPGMSQHLEQLGATILDELKRIRGASEDPTPVGVEVDIDSGRRTAELSITQRGL